MSCGSLIRRGPSVEARVGIGRQGAKVLFADSAAALRAAWWVLHKDILLDWRDRGRFLSVGVFGGVTLLLFSFAVGPDSRLMASGAPGFLILALVFSSTLALGESFRKENQDGGLQGLLLLSVPPASIFYAKALANTVFLLLLAPLLIPAALVLFVAEPTLNGLFSIGGIWALAVAGLAAPGALYAGLAAAVKNRELLLPLLLFPLAVPVVLSAVKAIASILNSGGPAGTGPWLYLLVGFNLIHWTLGGLLFAFAVQGD